MSKPTFAKLLALFKTYHPRWTDERCEKEVRKLVDEGWVQVEEKS